MAKLNPKNLTEFIEKGIEAFHAKRLERLKGLKLKEVLLRKNPYLFKAKNLITAPDLISSLLSAHLSSQEETMIGGLLEELAIFVSNLVHGGKKSSTSGIDLEFEITSSTNNALYIVSIKSGPNWANKSQRDKLARDFETAKKTLRTNAKARLVIAVEGCCYGRTPANNDHGGYITLCGQEFWKLISNSSTLYLDIIEPLGHKARERNQAFGEEHAKLINRLVESFISEFCQADGAIDWYRLVKFNSCVEQIS